MRKRSRGRRTRPIAECAPAVRESAPEKQPHATDPRRWADGTQRPGAISLNRKYPRVERDDAAVALVIRTTVDAIARDRGGRENLTTLQQRAIDHVVECDLLLQTWRDYFSRERPYTRQGRMRTGYTAYLSTLDRWMRLAQIVGMDRREKDLREDWFLADDDDDADTVPSTDDGNTQEADHDPDESDDQHHAATDGDHGDGD